MSRSGERDRRIKKKKKKKLVYSRVPSGVWVWSSRAGLTSTFHLFRPVTPFAWGRVHSPWALARPCSPAGEQKLQHESRTYIISIWCTVLILNHWVVAVALTTTLPNVDLFFLLYYATLLEVTLCRLQHESARTVSSWHATQILNLGVVSIAGSATLQHFQGVDLILFFFFSW